jgi:hypothetical protein
MGQRSLLIVGIATVAATVVVAAAAGVIGLSGSSIPRPGGMMGGFLGGGGGNIGIDRATSVARDVASSYPGRGLAVDEVIEFSNGYYASLREKSTGIGAFEILIDRSTGSVTREPGPDMMWNARYGMTGGMMPGGGGMMGGTHTRLGAASVSSSQARDIAQRWLDSNQPGTTASSPDPFYGYYTVDFGKDGRLIGMLSVNSSSGAVWYHSWHGSFVQVKDLGA